MTLFAYGTLLVPEIWRSVTGRACPSEPATLTGYAIRRVRGADFPGIVPAGPDDVVEGRIFSGLDAEMIARLDAYEDKFYDRLVVTLSTAGGDPVESQAYVVAPEFTGALSDQPWSLEWFRREAMADYMARHGFTA